MPAAQFLRRAVAPGRPERALLVSAALGATALIDPARLRPGGRAAYRLALAGTTGALVASDTEDDITPLGRAALATAAGGAVLGLSEAAEALDASVQRRMLRRGISKPRLIFAGVTFALALATELPAVFAARRARLGQQPGQLSLRGSLGAAADDTETIEDLPAGARALITGMLDFSADTDSETLRAQLASATERVWGGVSGSYDIIDIEVSDADALPRAVPHRQTFPVIAVFADPETQELRVVRLDIEDGRLARLSIEHADTEALGWAVDDVPSTASSAVPGSSSRGASVGPSSEAGLWPRTWPVLAEVTFLLESAAPVDSRAAKRARAQR